jgi:hypothetical protein
MNFFDDMAEMMRERRLKEIDGLVLFDFPQRYKIELPNGWKDIHSD